MENCMMKSVYFVLLLALAVLIWSCGSNEEPVSPPQYRISWIYADEAYHIFEYDVAGRIVKWDYNGSPNMSVASTFEYREQTNTIEIKSEETLTEKDVWSFDETLYLNPDGTADHVVGTVVLNFDGSRMIKNYTVDFQYNSSRQLVKLNAAERVVNDYGQEGSPLEWSAGLEWDGNNLVKYTEFSNPAIPMITKNYEYFGGQTVDYLPIVQGCILRRYYLPLQYQGVLGMNSVGLVKRMEVMSNNGDITTDFSYKMSASIYSSRVEEYTESRNGRESVYTVGWESKPTTVGN